MNSKTKSAIKIIALSLAVVLIAIYAVYQVFYVNKSPVSTETTIQQTVYKTIDTQMYIIKNEKYVTNDIAGTFVPLIANGNRVAVKDTLAVIFKNPDSAEKYTQLKELESEIKYYNSLRGLTSSQITDLSSIDSQIEGNISKIVEDIYSQRFESFHTDKLELRDSITHRTTVTGQNIDYTAVINDLTSKYNSLVGSASDYTEIKSDTSGYFVNSVDGFESENAEINVANLTVAEIDALINSEPSPVASNVVGKLLTNFTWYLVCNINTNELGDLKTGQTKEISFPYSGVGTIEARVYRINDSSDGKTAVVFYADLMNSDIATLRCESAQIRIEEYDGYRVNNSAIRIVDGEKGVFILRDKLVSFRKINVIYEGTDFSIVNNPENSSRFIRLYDEVIVEGTDLYDGKLIT